MITFLFFDIICVMILPSYSFIFIFLPLVVILYHLANSRQLYLAGKVILLLSSAVFYALLTPGIKGLAALFVSVLVCYLLATFGLGSGVPKAVRKISLAFGVTASISFLIYCRYLGYINELLVNSGGTGLTFEAVIVPVGISYFTFSQIAYLVDTYRDPDTRYSFADYLLFVSFFPKISVGPIALAGEMIPQFNDPSRKKLDYDNLSKGFYRFTLGLSKKLLLADSLGKYADSAYANIPSLGSADAALAILSYTLQIYFDFSGYCDIASGICRMLNIDLCENFDGPYKSLSIREFWKRWHISLTRFFRNYLYIPMGGNRKGKIRTWLNNLFIFLISGLWHGAATHFIIWGGIHGLGMMISKMIAPFTEKVPRILRHVATFIFVSLAWVFFRAEDTGLALDMLSRLFKGGLVPINSSVIAMCTPAEFRLIQWIILKQAPDLTYYSSCAIWIFLVAVGLYFSAFSDTVKKRCDNFAASRKKTVTTVLLFTWSVLSLSEVTEFIYVNF